MNFEIHNSLNHRDEFFEHSKETEINLYTCGPTVYNYVHIGNLRAYLFPDILKRVLEFNGYKVRWVMNITDVDDKTIANTIKKYGSNAGVKELNEFTQEYFDKFLEDLNKINIDAEKIHFVKVTDKIKEIQEFILELLEKGYAYKADDGSTYFNIQKYQNDFKDYGKLVGEKFLEGKKIGARVKVDEYDKDNLSDFALWKAHGSDDANIFWEHPTLGKGRPGWHIECTVINHDTFNAATDIHTGGIDLMFPHHTNEIAQAQPIYKPFVRYWMHSEHILVDNKKMAKSLGNVYILNDLIQEGIMDGLDLRFLILQSHYRSQLNITKESLRAAKNGLNKMREQLGILKSQNSEQGVVLSEYLEKFNYSINNDLNTAEALALSFEILNSNEKPENKLATVLEFDKVFGLKLNETWILPRQFVKETELDQETKDLVQIRDQARKNRDFKTSDKIRKELENKGYEVLDTPEGTKIRKNS